MNGKKKPEKEKPQVKSADAQKNTDTPFLAAELFRLATVFVFAFFLFHADAAAAAGPSERFERKILIYYSAGTAGTYYSNDALELLGIFINYYGYDFRLQNLDDGIGDDKLRDWADIYAVCQYEYFHRNADALCDYLISVIDKKRVVLLELPGSPSRQEKLIEKMGFACHEFVKGADIKRFKDYASLAPGETPINPSTAYDYYRVSPLPGRPDAKAHLSAAGDGTSECPLIATSNNGAILFIGKLIDTDKDYNRRWMADPFKVSQLLFSGGKKFPVPDPCVQSGRRAAFIHIDGDGFNYRTEFNDARRSGEVIYEEIISRYRFPTTASLIASEINPADFGSDDLEKAAAALLKESYVEPASHSWYHPFKWHLLKSGVPERYAEDTEETDQIQEMKLYNPGDRTRETSLEKEIIDSCRYITKLAGRECRVMCWTGMCNPTIDALRIADREGIYNINGGDTRFDDEFRLYSNLRPHYSPNGEFIRFNARYVNEFIMTQHWCPPYDNYKKVIEGFKNTFSPHLLTPINIYYHFYSGTRRDSLNAIKQVYDYAASQAPSFMTASGWIRRVRGFIDCSITRTQAPEKITVPASAAPYYGAGELKCLGAYKFDDNGELDNFRWDHEGWPLVDPSRGVAGFNEINGSIYINTAAYKSGEILIVDRPPSGLYLRSLSAKTLSARNDPGAEGVYDIEALVTGPFKAVIANAKHPSYRIYYTNSRGETVEYAAKIDGGSAEMTFESPYEDGKVRLSIHYSTRLGIFKSFLFGSVTRLYYFLTKNPVIILLIMIYAYFTIQNRRQRKKQAATEDKKR